MGIISQASLADIVRNYKTNNRGRARKRPQDSRAYVFSAVAMFNIVYFGLRLVEGSYETSIVPALSAAINSAGLVSYLTQ